MKINAKLFEKLPKYAKKWDWVYLDKGFNDFGIDAMCKADDADPDKRNVVFVCDNFNEFLWHVRKYKNDFKAQHRE